MEIKGEAQRVTVYIDESDKWQRKPLYLAILEMLREEDCAGATVIRALAGFGAHSRIKTTRIEPGKPPLQSSSPATGNILVK